MPTVSRWPLLPQTPVLRAGAAGARRLTSLAILDDYQWCGRGPSSAGRGVRPGVEVVAFPDHLSDPDALVARLALLDVDPLAMRERTPFDRSWCSPASPNLALLITTGPFNAAIDMLAAR